MNDSVLIDCFPVFSTPEFIYVGVVRIVSSVISILMCSTALLLIVILKRWRIFSQKLTIHLLISALLSSVGHLISVDYNHGHSTDLKTFCVLSAFLFQVTVWMLQDANFAVTIYLFLLIVLDFNTDKYEWSYGVSIYGIPFIINWIPFIRLSYGRSGAWCWITEIEESNCETDSFGQYLQYILYYGPVYFLLITGTILYVIIFINLSRKQRKSVWVDGYQVQHRLKKMKTELLSLIAYPIIFAVLNIVSIVNHTLFVIRPDEPLLAVWYLAAAASPMQGGFTALAFVLITKEWRNISCSKLWAMFKKERLIEWYPMENYAVTDSYTGPMHEYTAYPP